MACAEARQRAAYLAVSDLRETIERLTVLAGNAHERTLIANVEIVGGVATREQRIFQEGLQRLCGATVDELTETLQWFADLTILGTPLERQAVLMRAVVAASAPDDPATNFIDDPGLADAREILAGRWAPPPTLPTPLARELRRWLAWAALDAWLSWRRPEYLMLARHPAVKFGPDEEGAWEYVLLEAIVDLAQNSVEEACARVRRITRGQRVPTWAPDRIARVATTYCPLAGSKINEWEAALPAPLLTPDRASEPAERAGAAFRAVIDRNKHAELMRVKDDVTARGWTTFTYFVASQPGHVSTELGQALLTMVKRPDDVSCWPWPGRVHEFAEACEGLDDQRLALSLLAVALRTMPKDLDLTGACVRILESCGPKELSALVGDDLWQLLGVATSGLSAGKQMMLKRGGVWRAVVDGTNVVFAGKDRAAGGQASLARIKEAWASLRTAGFEQIITWFDASTRHYLSTPECAELARLHAAGDVCIVSSGPADPMVIETFLEAPAQTWVVTCDRYTQWQPSFPALAQHWPGARLEFQVDHNAKLRWSRPLDRPGRSRG